MPTTTYQLVSLSDLRASTDPAQRRVDPTGADIAELAASIAATGLLEPLIVRPAADADGEFVVIAGHRRLAALQLLEQQLTEDDPTVPEMVDGVPCLVRASSDPGQDTVAALVENLQRVNLTPLEEATALRVLRDDHGWSQVAIATAIGRTQGHVSKRLTLLKLTPELLGAVQDARMTVETAVDVARLTKAGQARVAALLEDGQTPENALKRVRREQAEEADRVKVVRGLDAEEWPALAGTRVLDERNPSQAAEARDALGTHVHPGAVLTRPADGQWVPALLDAGVPADAIVLLVSDHLTSAYPTGDLDRALAAWTRLLVREDARAALRERQTAERDETLHDAGLDTDPRTPDDRPAGPATEGLGALIPPRADDFRAAALAVGADHTDELPTATGDDVDHALITAVGQLPPEPETVLPAEPAPDVADELTQQLDELVRPLDPGAPDPEEWEHLLSAVAAVARDLDPGDLLTLLSAHAVWRAHHADDVWSVHPSSPMHRDLATEALGLVAWPGDSLLDHPALQRALAGALVLTDLAWCQYVLEAGGRLPTEPAAAAAREILRAAGVALWQQPAQADEAPDAPQEGAETAHTTDDSQQGGRREPARSEANDAPAEAGEPVGLGPIDLSGRPRVGDLREALAARGVTEYRGAALAGLRRAELEQAADEWNVAQAASDGGA